MTRFRWRRENVRPLSFVVIAVAIVGGPTVGAVWLWNHWPEQASDQVATVGAVATVVAVWLALIAAVVALLAYIVADEAPDLSVLLDEKPLASGFDLHLTNPTADRFEVAAPPYLVFRLVNHSGFSARNPAIRVSFTDAIAVDPATSPAWGVTYRTADDISLQWYGGADISVHGHWDQIVPPLVLVGSTQTWVRQGIGITVEVVAEGFRLPAQKVPVRVHFIPVAS